MKGLLDRSQPLLLDRRVGAAEACRCGAAWGTGWGASSPLSSVSMELGGEKAGKFVPTSAVQALRKLPSLFPTKLCYHRAGQGAGSPAPVSRELPAPTQ